MVVVVVVVETTGMRDWWGFLKLGNGGGCGMDVYDADLVNTKSSLFIVTLGKTGQLLVYDSD